MKILLMLDFIACFAMVLAAFRAMAVANGAKPNRIDPWITEIACCASAGFAALLIAILVNLI